jgi:hypothetical protein
MSTTREMSTPDESLTSKRAPYPTEGGASSIFTRPGTM